MTTVISIHKDSSCSWKVSCHSYDCVMSVLCTPLQIKCYLNCLFSGMCTQTTTTEAYSRGKTVCLAPTSSKTVGTMKYMGRAPLTKALAGKVKTLCASHFAAHPVAVPPVPQHLLFSLLPELLEQRWCKGKYKYTENCSLLLLLVTFCAWMSAMSVSMT